MFRFVIWSGGGGGRQVRLSPELAVGEEKRELLGTLSAALSLARCRPLCRFRGERGSGESCVSVLPLVFAGLREPICSAQQFRDVCVRARVCLVYLYDVLLLFEHSCTQIWNQTVFKVGRVVRPLRVVVGSITISSSELLLQTIIMCNFGARLHCGLVVFKCVVWHDSSCRCAARRRAAAVCFAASLFPFFLLSLSKGINGLVFVHLSFTSCEAEEESKK
jgi:hypothetical protein